MPNSAAVQRGSMDIMLKHHPHDYLPAAGHDALLPGYDLLTRLFGFHRVHDKLIGQAELAGAQRILEIGCGTGNLAIRAKKSHPSIDVIGSDYVNRWMALLGADGEIAGAAANFQDPLRPGEFGLADQLVMDAVEAEQPGQQVVAGKQRVVAGGGEVVMWMMFEHNVHTAPLHRGRIGHSLSKVGLFLATPHDTSNAGYQPPRRCACPPIPDRSGHISGIRAAARPRRHRRTWPSHPRFPGAPLCPLGGAGIRGGPG